MPYGKFETIEQVADTFEIEVTRGAFIQKEKLEVNEIILKMIAKRFLEDAKQENWKKGWAQALTEMYAASTQGAATCYAAVTTGVLWQFGRLDNGTLFTRDPLKLSAIENLPGVLDTLNWLFGGVVALVEEAKSAV